MILYNGRPLTIGWVADHVPAILEAWLPGTEGGNAIADILFGNVNPGAKLPVTFPRVVGQVPLHYNHLNTGRPAQAGNRYTSKYLDVPIGPLFAFGHGLSYTRFQLSGLKLSRREIPPDGRLAVSVDVQNVGDRPGEEVVQLYIRDLVASVARPVKELAGFERVSLQPGETKTLRFELGPEAWVSTTASFSSSSSQVNSASSWGQVAWEDSKTGSGSAEEMLRQNRDQPTELVIQRSRTSRTGRRP